jgi:hypothetical protein
MLLHNCIGLEKYLGGKVILLDGDFRQDLPATIKGSISLTVDSTHKGIKHEPNCMY